MPIFVPEKPLLYEKRETEERRGSTRAQEIVAGTVCHAGGDQGDAQRTGDVAV